MRFQASGMWGFVGQRAAMLLYENIHEHLCRYFLASFTNHLSP